MVTTDHIVMIERPLADVWAFLMNITNYLQWQTDVRSIEATDGMNPGSVIAYTTSGIGKVLQIRAIVAHNDGVSNFHVVSGHGPMRFESRYYLQQVGHRTRLHIAHLIDTKGLYTLAAPVLQSIGESRLDQDLARLKRILETSVTPV